MSRESGRVVTLGETMALVRAAHVGSLATESEMRLGVGGAESNVAIALSRLGTPATWLGRVGADPLGERILRELRAEGVDARAIVDDGAPTGLMVKESRTPTSTRVLYYRSASAGSRLSVEDVATADIATAGLLHVSGITPALSESAAAAVDAAIDAAGEAGIPVSFDVNHRASLWVGRDSSSVYRRLAARSTIVFAGEDEARLLAEGESPAASPSWGRRRSSSSSARTAASRSSTASSTTRTRSASTRSTPSAPGTRSSPATSRNCSRGSPSPIASPQP